MNCLLWISTLLLLGWCHGQDCFGEGPPRSYSAVNLAKGADTFAINVFKNIALKYNRNSIVVSPYSVWSVLKLAYLGARGNTETELERALKIPSKPEAFYAGNIIDSKLRSDAGTTFDKADKVYMADDMQVRQCVVDRLPSVESIDFRNPPGAANIINRHVAAATRGKINNFLSADVIRGARFILMNAVYFKGNWTFPFPKEATGEKPFFNDQGRQISNNTNMMSVQAKLNYAESAVLGATVLELPYDNSNISMYLLVPSQESSDINSVIAALSSDEIEKVERDFKISHVVVFLPRFKMTTRIAQELKEALEKEGITDLFDVKRSDLSGFVESERAFVDNSLHHATIEVTEEGTVAAAVTTLIGTRSGAQETKVFRADKPFVFLIRDKQQGITLFSGVLRNPKHTTAF